LVEILFLNLFVSDKAVSNRFINRSKCRGLQILFGFAGNRYCSAYFPGDAGASFVKANDKKTIVCTMVRLCIS